MAAKKRTKSVDSLKLAKTIIKGILEKKGKKIVCLDLKGIDNAVADYFIICQGDSNVQVDAIARSVEETTLLDLGEKPWRTEGRQNALWVLIDYVTVVVHVFQQDERMFYKLEDLWADAKEVKGAFQKA